MTIHQMLVGVGVTGDIVYVNSATLTSGTIYTLMGSPTAAGTYVFINNNVIKASSTSFALRTGVFPAGSTLKIINNSTLYGIGGNGGQYNTAGSPGGVALYLDMNCTLDNTNGNIFGGGGGGGGSHVYYYTSTYARAGGGSGAGSQSGTIYANAGATTILANTQPTVGGLTSGGAGGNIRAGFDANFYGTAIGGVGGNSGAAGATSTGTYVGTVAKTIVTRVGGAGGSAIVKNGYTLNFIGGNNGTQVKGAIV